MRGIIRFLRDAILFGTPPQEGTSTRERRYDHNDDSNDCRAGKTLLTGLVLAPLVGCAGTVLRWNVRGNFRRFDLLGSAFRIHNRCSARRTKLNVVGEFSTA